MFEIYEEGMSYIAPEYNTACAGNQKIFIECEGEQQLIATLTGEDIDGGNLYNGLTEADYDNDIGVDVTCFNRNINIQLAGSFTAENGDCVVGAGWDGFACGQCAVGTSFSDEISIAACKTCATCDSDEFVLSPCTTEADTVCCKDYLVANGDNTQCICPLTGFTDNGSECVCQSLLPESETFQYEFTDPVTNIRECKSISYTDLNTEANSCSTYSAEELAAINTVLNQFSSSECPLDLD